MMREPVTGVILAGGRGQRMGGADKGLQLFDGQPLVRWVIERFAPQVDTLIISANRNLAHYEALGFPVIGDRIPGFAGPLAGLHAALTHTRDGLVATVPCDVPFLPADLIARLRAALVVSSADLASVRAGGKQHPVFCLCHTRILPQLSAFLAGGKRRMLDWQQTVNTRVVDFDDDVEDFRNLNTTADLVVNPLGHLSHASESSSVSLSP